LAVKDLYDKACEAANKGNYEYSIELFREVLRLEVEYPGARLLLRGTERRRVSEMASFLAPVTCFFKGLVPMIKASLQFKDARKKLECWEDVLENSPNSMGALVAGAQAARRAELPEVAITILKDLLSLKPDHKAALRELGEVFEEVNRTKEALSALLKLTELVPNDRLLQQKVRNLEAQAHMQETRLDEAGSFRDTIRDKGVADEAVRKFETADERRVKQIEAAEQDMQQDPDNVNKIVRLADFYEQDGKFDMALRVLKEADERMPNAYTIRERMGDVQLRMLEAAIEKVGKQAGQSPDNAELQKKKEDLQTKARRLAVREFTWRVEQHPTDNALRLNFGRALFEDGQVEKAIASFQQASKDPRLQLEASLMLGRSFCAKKQFDLAVEQFNKVIARHAELDEQGMKFHYMLGDALEQQGDKAGALAVYKKIYSNDIGFRDVAQKVEALGS